MGVWWLSDVDLGARKSYLTTDNDSWFVSEDDYEEVSQIALYLWEKNMESYLYQ